MSKVFKYGDNIDTDVIIPARYLNISNRDELASHALEDLDISFAKSVRIGDIIVAGENFGCGSSREHAPMVLKNLGVKLIIAKSFARIFFRNSINIGLAICEDKQASMQIDNGDELSFDLEKGVILDLTKNLNFSIAPFPPFIQNIIQKGGLLNSLK